MKKGKSQQSKLVVAFPKGLCLGGRTGSFGSRAEPRWGGCCCTVPLLTLLPMLSRSLSCLRGARWACEERHCPLPTQGKHCLLSSGLRPAKDQLWEPRWSSWAPSGPMQGWPQPLHLDVASRVAKTRSLLLRECPSTARSQSWAALEASTTVLLSSTLAWCNAAVVRMLTWTTVSEVQSSPENSGSGCSSCQRSYFE